MALTLPCETKKAVSIAEYVDHVKTMNLRDSEALIASAPMLRALANDRGLVVRQLNQEIENSFRSSYLPSAQTLYLGGGTDFYVRAAVWPSSAAVAGGRLYQDKFAYHVAHDHNFSFLTVNYSGPGYETAIYEYDHDAVEGYVGEVVDLRFLERVRFGQGTVMFYRANRDVHIQYPPEELTVTLNLMVSLPETRARDQFFFDVTRKAISDYVADTDTSKRVALIKMAGHVGNDETSALLGEISRRHSCRRARWTAVEALCQREPSRTGEILEAAAGDQSSYVANAAKRMLKLVKG